MQIKPFISILIPTRNRFDSLKDLLDCIIAQDYPHNRIEILVLDNASEDNTWHLLKEYSKNNPDIIFKKFHLLINSGICYSREFLLEKIENYSDLIITIDDDIIFPLNTLRKVVDIVFNNKADILGVEVRDQKGQLTSSARFINKFTGFFYEKYTKNNIECDWVIGCFLCVKTKIAKELKFSYEFYSTQEEVDFCLRAKNKGYMVIYSPEISIIHKFNPFTGFRKERLYYLYRNKILLIKRNFKPFNKFTAILIHILFSFPKSLFDSIKRNKKIDFKEFKIIFLAFLDGLSGIYGKYID